MNTDGTLEYISEKEHARRTQEKAKERIAGLSRKERRKRQRAAVKAARREAKRA